MINGKWHPALASGKSESHAPLRGAVTTQLHPAGVLRPSVVRSRYFYGEATNPEYFKGKIFGFFFSLELFWWREPQMWRPLVEGAGGALGFVRSFSGGSHIRYNRHLMDCLVLGVEWGGGREPPALGIRNAYLSGRKYEVTLNHVK